MSFQANWPVVEAALRLVQGFPVSDDYQTWKLALGVPHSIPSEVASYWAYLITKDAGPGDYAIMSVGSAGKRFELLVIHGPGETTALIETCNAAAFIARCGVLSAAFRAVQAAGSARDYAARATPTDGRE